MITLDASLCKRGKPPNTHFELYHFASVSSAARLGEQNFLRRGLNSELLHFALISLMRRYDNARPR